MPDPDVAFVTPEPPSGFTLDRTLASGRHPILRVFPGLNDLAIAHRLQPDDALRHRLFRDAEIELVEDDVWMYVAPWEIPASRRGRWNPVLAPGTDCIVVGLDHLRESPSFTLFLDIFHELRHVLQRQGGAQLFGSGESYVKRPTEVDAYRFVVDEAHRLNVSDDFLRDYLKVEWIDEKEFLQLLTAVGVALP
jgi:hypothetical protein